jgi:phospholipid/cholesterol/gamma-HCH transport system substrate-binding protein
MKKNTFEIIMGFMIIIIAILFAWFICDQAYFAYNKKDKSYSISAKFQNISGIIQGSDVMIAGIKIGQVDVLHLDPETYQAVIILKINDDVKLPINSTASVVSSGVVGNKFIVIEPGSAEVNLKNGDSISHTTSAINLEALIGKFIYSIGNKTSQ